MTTTPLAPPGSLTDRVAEEIRSVMGRRKVTGAQLAKLLGVSAAWVSYRVNGSVSPSMADLERIATALNVEVGDLLPSAVLRAGHSIGRYHPTGTSRPSGRRPASRPARGGPPPGPGRTSRIHPPIAA